MCVSVCACVCGVSVLSFVYDRVYNLYIAQRFTCGYSTLLKEMYFCSSDEFASCCISSTIRCMTVAFEK